MTQSDEMRHGDRFTCHHHTENPGARSLANKMLEALLNEKRYEIVQAACDSRSSSERLQNIDAQANLLLSMRLSDARKFRLLHHNGPERYYWSALRAIACLFFILHLFPTVLLIVWIVLAMAFMFRLVVWILK